MLIALSVFTQLQRHHLLVTAWYFTLSVVLVWVDKSVCAAGCPGRPLLCGCALELLSR